MESTSLEWSSVMVEREKEAEACAARDKATRCLVGQTLASHNKRPSALIQTRLHGQPHLLAYLFFSTYRHGPPARPEVSSIRCPPVRAQDHYSLQVK